ncbi:MAG: hypothetical protein AB1637_09605 [Elusimicrobiota bacterium]
MKLIKHYCLIFLTMLPIIVVSFAAQSALNIDQIGIQNASDNDLGGGGPLSESQKR